MSSEEDCLILQILLYKLSDLTFCTKNLLMSQEEQGTCSSWLKQTLWTEVFLLL